MHRNVSHTWLSLTLHANIRDGHRIRYLWVWQFNSLRGLGIDIIGRVHFDNPDRFSISMGSIGKGTEPCQQITECLLTSDFWLFLEPWHARWYQYEIFIASCTDRIYIYDLENERWLFGDMIDHVGFYGSRVAEGLSASNVGLVVTWQSGHFWLRYNKFHIWPWKFKVKVMAKVKPDGHIWGLEFNRCVCFSFHGNWTIFGWDI